MEVMDGITVERATVADIPILVVLASGLAAEDAGSRDDTVDVDWARKHGAERFSLILGDPARVVLVARAAGTTAGSLVGGLVDPAPIRPVRVAELRSLYVRPEYRGHGVGARLVEEFRAWARAAGAGHMYVTAYSANVDAVRFYQRQGFVPHETTLKART